MMRIGDPSCGAKSALPTMGVSLHPCGTTIVPRGFTVSAPTRPVMEYKRNAPELPKLWPPRFSIRYISVVSS